MLLQVWIVITRVGKEGLLKPDIRQSYWGADERSLQGRWIGKNSSDCTICVLCVLCCVYTLREG